MNLILAVCLSIASLLPQADDSFWRDSIPDAMRQSYIRHGEEFLGKSWTVLPVSLFSEYSVNGNRSNYEYQSFRKRRQLAALVMAEIVEGRQRFLPDIVKGLNNICDEPWWGVPAHYDKPEPDPNNQVVDLFNAETASMLGWTAYMLESRLNEVAPGLCDRISREIHRRFLEPARTINYSWKRRHSNWNPWICSNWLTCVLLYETDEAHRAEAIAQIKQATQLFIDSYPEDGGCDEGPGYWDRAAASMFEILRLFDAMSDPSFFHANRRKIEAMAAYAYKTYIGNNYCVSFADSQANKAVQQVNIVFSFGQFLGDDVMRQFGACLGQQQNVLTDPAPIFHKSGSVPALGRELFFLRHISDFMAETPREPLLDDAWLESLQIMTARRGTYFLAMKGGTNGETHNHNDVGSFIVFTSSYQPDGSRTVAPLLIDPAVGEYSGQTFSGGRYDIWTMQSGYHNLPKINGIDQKDGADYAAELIKHKRGQLRLELAGAYPAEAAVKSWRRTVAISESGVTVTEKYKLRDYRLPTELIFMTTCRPSLSSPSEVSLGDHTITFDADDLEATIEDISSLLDPLLQRMWGKAMYRIHLSTKSSRLKGTLEYTIR